MEMDILELINRRRRQILIHSFLYYRMNTSIITDSTYDTWALELIDLQRKYPEVANKGVFSDAFSNFTESVSGFNLPLNEPWVIGTGTYILNLYQKKQQRLP